MQNKQKKKKNISGTGIIAIILVLAFVLGFAACGNDSSKDEPNRGPVDEPVIPNEPTVPDEPTAPDEPVIPEEPAVPDDSVSPDEPGNPQGDEPLQPVVEPVKEPVKEDPPAEPEKEPVKEDPPVIETPENNPAGPPAVDPVEPPVVNPPAIEPTEEDPIVSNPPADPPAADDPVVSAPPETVTPKYDLAYMNEKRADYIMKFNRTISREDAVSLAELFEGFAASRDYIDTETLMGIARNESGFQNIIGESYAGPMQISLKYGQLAGYSMEQLLEPRYSIEYAMTILDFGHGKFPDNLSYVLYSYNYGYYGFKAKLDRGDEITSSFADRVYRFADEIRALY